MPERACARCGAPVTACMGFVYSSDFLRFMEGTLGDDPVRELCGRCDIELFVVDPERGEALASDCP